MSVSEKTDVLYNTLSDKYLFVRKGLLDSNTIDKHSSCYENLISGGFLLDDSIDETKLCIEQGREIENDLTNAHLIINPTINCNFNCWYCYEKHIPSKMTSETIDNIKKLIENLCAKSKRLTISFFGGEPFLYYSDIMMPIIKMANRIALEKGVYFATNCTTNGSLLNKERVQELKQYNFNFAQITLDGDRNTHNKTRCYSNGKGSFDKIIENIKLLAINRIKVTLRINYTKENIKGVENIPFEFDNLTNEEKKFIDVSFHKVWQESDFDSRIIKKSIDNFVKSGFVASKFVLGSYCYGDLRNSVVINYNGDIFKCTAVDFENTLRDGYLNTKGEIVWENNSLEKRMKAKYSNKPCLECRIMPICHGGCSSKPLEKGTDYCIFDFDEDKKLKAVEEKLLYNIKFKWNK